MKKTTTVKNLFQVNAELLGRGLRFFTRASGLLALTATLSCSAAPQAKNAQEVTAEGDELTWPRVFDDNGTTVSIYQPQIETWEGTDFETTSAVATTPARAHAPPHTLLSQKAHSVTHMTHPT